MSCPAGKLLWSLTGRCPKGTIGAYGSATREEKVPGEGGRVDAELSSGVGLLGPVKVHLPVVDCLKKDDIGRMRWGDLDYEEMALSGTTHALTKRGEFTRRLREAGRSLLSDDPGECLDVARTTARPVQQHFDDGCLSWKEELERELILRIDATRTDALVAAAELHADDVEVVVGNLLEVALDAAQGRLSERRSARTAVLKRRVVELLKATPGSTRKQIAEAVVFPSLAVCSRIMAELMAEGIVVREGERGKAVYDARR